MLNYFNLQIQPVADKLKSLLNENKPEPKPFELWVADQLRPSDADMAMELAQWFGNKRANNLVKEQNNEQF